MLKILGKILFAFLFVSIADASVPKDLIVQNRPIDALCFFNMEGHSKRINLNHCGYSTHKYIIKGKNPMLIKRGFIGYDWQDPTLNSAIQGHSYYKIFNAGNHQYWIYAINNGGGNGDFTAIQFIKRKNTSTLETKTIVSGDRCNGGLQNVSEKNNQLTFSINLTAYSFIGLAKNHHYPVKAYNDLAACAACCVAKAFYTVSANAKPQLQYITLSDIKNTQEMPSQGKQQTCFNKLFTTYVTSGKTQLKQNKLIEFVNKFNQTCAKN